MVKTIDILSVLFLLLFFLISLLEEYKVTKRGQITEFQAGIFIQLIKI